MTALPWFRLFSEARNDAKLRTLADDEHRVWFGLLCLAAEQGDRGAIPAADAYLLAIEVAGGDEELLTRTVDKLVRLRIVRRDDDGAIVFVNFLKRQYDKLSDAPDATRERKARQRAKARDTDAQKADVTPMSRDVTPRHNDVLTQDAMSRQNDPKAPDNGQIGGVTSLPENPATTADSENVTRSHAIEERRVDKKRVLTASPLPSPPLANGEAAAVRLFLLFCEITQTDTATMPTATTTNQRRIFTGLLQTHSDADIEGCMRWLGSWRDVPWKPDTIGKEIDAWILEGRPKNGRRSPKPKPTNAAPGVVSFGQGDQQRKIIGR